MTLKALFARLVVATLVPVILVTATLYPVFTAHLEARLESLRMAAEALLEARYQVLLQDMNESLNQVLVTAELPLLRRYLVSRLETLSPARDIAAQRDMDELEALFDTLLMHSGRYTRLTLLDTGGDERLSVTSAQWQPTSPIVNYAATDSFQEAMGLQNGDLYVSPPHLMANDGSGKATTAVIDIATPVVNENGTRLGVVLFALDWSRITASLSGRKADHTQPLLVDAQGTWLLSEAGKEGIAFGSSLVALWPDAWQAMASRNRGDVVLEKQLLHFRTYDIRTSHYRSQAGVIMSQPDTQPWRFGIMTPKPSLLGLLMESPGQILAIALAYSLSIAVGIFWVLSHHRQRSLRQRALQFSREARQYAGEVQDFYENAPCGYHSLDSEGRVIKINRTELGWLGYRADEVVDKRRYRDFITPETRVAFDAAFQQVLGMGQEGSAECELLCRDGTILPVAIQATAQVTEEGFQYSRATVFDLSERKQLEARLEQQAMSDPLTGLGNRRYLEAQAAIEIARAQRSAAPLSLIAADLDRFKRINDNYGHDVGDLVLQAFADTAREQLRDGDVLCRIGGEEFVVLLPDTTGEQAMQVAERLRQAVEAMPVEVGSDVNEVGRLTYSASLGVTLVNAEETSIKPAIKRADQGLYAAKEAGRNQVRWQSVHGESCLPAK